jgi:hypothetical protein
LCSERTNRKATSSFVADLGQLVVRGPRLSFSRPCISAQNCWIEQIVGTDLDVDDKLMILDTCGIGRPTYSGWTKGGLMSEHGVFGTIPVGFGGILGIVQKSLHQMFDFSKVHVTTTGGQFRMCWCASDSAGGSCNDPAKARWSCKDRHFSTKTGRA